MSDNNNNNNNNQSTQQPQLTPQQAQPQEQPFVDFPRIDTRTRIEKGDPGGSIHTKDHSLDE